MTRNFSLKYKYLILSFFVWQVTTHLSLYSVLDLDELRQMITTNVEVVMSWNDKFLAWDPVEFGNISMTRLPWDSVWTPDVVLLNVAGDGDQGRETRWLLLHWFDLN